MSTTPTNDKCETLIKQINKGLLKIYKNDLNNLTLAIPIGHDLNALKDLCSHGEWRIRVAQNINFNMTTANKYMLLATNEKKLGTYIKESGSKASISGAHTFIKQAHGKVSKVKKNKEAEDKESLRVAVDILKPFTNVTTWINPKNLKKIGSVGEKDLRHIVQQITFTASFDRKIELDKRERALEKREATVKAREAALDPKTMTDDFIAEQVAKASKKRAPRKAA